jgi:NADH-quinone oxidoreductase subunit G
MSETRELTEMVTLTIDGQEVTVPKGTTILQAAELLGNRVPHYCYHPGLSRPAQCRLCLVEVEGMPKMLPSCVTTVMPGQVVHTESEKAREQRQGVLEFYLANHPLDCPICDQSGECKLQDYVHAEGRDHGRSREPKRVFGRDDFGGDVLFYGDRCVMCTRCVRFMNEMAQDPRLTVVERGNRSIIDTFFEEGLHGSPYAGNVVDICPVGALVSKDFLHKARAWDLDHTPSICPNCSQGCNIELHVRDNLVQRLKPRENAEVNQFWMCDYGRNRYEGLNRGGRVTHPGLSSRWAALGGEGEGATRPETEGALLDAAALRLQKAASAGGVHAVASPFSSNEDLAALRRLVDALGGGVIEFRVPMAEDEIPLPGFPKLRRRRELAPNGTAADRLGMVRVGEADGAGGLDTAQRASGVLLVLGDSLSDASPEFGSSAGMFVHLAVHADGDATPDLVFPLLTFAETEGSFTNFEGRVQRFWPGLQGPELARPGWWILSELTARVGGGSAPSDVRGAFEAAKSVFPGLAGLVWEQLGLGGSPLAAEAALAGSRGGEG